MLVRSIGKTGKTSRRRIMSRLFSTCEGEVRRSMTLFTGRGDVASRYRHLYSEFQNVSSVRDVKIDFDTRDVYEHVEECRRLGIKEIPTILYRYGDEEHVLKGANSKNLTETLSVLGVKFDETSPMAIRTLGDLLAERTEIVDMDSAAADDDGCNGDHDDVGTINNLKVLESVEQDQILMACLEDVLSEADEMELLWENEQRRARKEEEERKREGFLVEDVKRVSRTSTRKQSSPISSDVMELLNLLNDVDDDVEVRGLKKTSRSSHTSSKTKESTKRRVNKNGVTKKHVAKFKTRTTTIDSTNKRKKKKRASRRSAGMSPYSSSTEPISEKKFISTSASYYSTRSGLTSTDLKR